MAIDTGDTAWLLMSTALVFIMIPAVGFFYGGMLRKQSMLSILGQTIIIPGMVTLIWVIAGFSLAFGSNGTPYLGDLNWIMLRGVGQSPLSAAYGATIPGILFMMFQGMFAIITVALIIGGVAERMRLKALVIFLGHLDIPGLHSGRTLGLGRGIPCPTWGLGLRRRDCGAHHRRDLSPCRCSDSWQEDLGE